MGLGGSIKKSVKKAVKHVTSGAKSMVKNPLSLEGAVGAASVATGGLAGGVLASGALGMEQEKQEKSLASEVAKARQAAQEEDYMSKYGWKNMAELVKARKKKEEELSTEARERGGGVGTLIGRGTTLG